MLKWLKRFNKKSKVKNKTSSVVVDRSIFYKHDHPLSENLYFDINKIIFIVKLEDNFVNEICKTIPHLKINERVDELLKFTLETCSLILKDDLHLSKDVALLDNDGLYFYIEPMDYQESIKIIEKALNIIINQFDNFYDVFTKFIDFAKSNHEISMLLSANKAAIFKNIIKEKSNENKCRELCN